MQGIWWQLRLHNVPAAAISEGRFSTFALDGCGCATARAQLGNATLKAEAGAEAEPGTKAEVIGKGKFKPRPFE